jgi:hypothetical protein
LPDYTNGIETYPSGRYIYQPLAGPDGTTYIDFILQKTALDWTAVRPVVLSNNKKEREILVSLNNEERPGLKISRKNLARFMIRILEDNSYIRQSPVVFE